MTGALGHHFICDSCTRCDEKRVCPSDGYLDIPDTSDWAHEGIDFAIERGLMNGVDTNLFAPEETMNRGMFVTVLWRLEGMPAAAENATFSDVPAGTWYSEAVAWAQSEGIVKGIEEGRFDPTGEITREQMATILYRHALSKQLPTERGDLTRFADSGAVSPWAAEGVCWAEKHGILQGSDEGDGLLLMPAAALTRAQAAAILMRYCNVTEGAE